MSDRQVIVVVDHDGKEVATYSDNRWGLEDARHHAREIGGNIRFTFNKEN